MSATETFRQAPEWATSYTRRAIEACPVELATATPPQVDEVIRTVQLDAQALSHQADRAVVAVRRAIGQESREEKVYASPRSRKYSFQTVWPTSAGTAEATAREMDPASRASYYGPTVGEALATLDALRDQIAEAARIEQEMVAEFVARGGWTRYFMVNNSNGHVHTSTACRTCYATTQFGWPTQLSGATGAEVVEAAGPLTCLTCFPNEREDILANRPVRFDAFETPEQRDERVKRNHEIAERIAAKIAKGVTEDGSTLVVKLGRHHLIGFGSTLEVKTERAAELRYVELAALAQTGKSWVAEDDKAVAARAAGELAEALAWKRGTTAAAQVAKLAPKVARKVAAEW